MNNKNLDFLPHTNFLIHQREDMYHFNTDSVLLGNFIMIKHKDRVLDIGCNNGVLMLYASKFGPKELCGIDIFQEVLELARENLERYQIQASLKCCDFASYENGQFDKLICNPPYFMTGNNHLKNDNKYIRAARHESSLTLEVLFKNSYRIMKDKASLYLVHRASRLTEILAISRSYQLKATNIQLCYANRNSEAKSVLIEFKKGRVGEVKILPACFIDEL